MMKWIFSGLILLSVVCGIAQGRMDAVTNAAITDCSGAVQLTITLAGGMCLWSGFMKVAEKADLTAKLCRLLSPCIRFLFRGLDHKGAAARAITLNISANLLGLGNAATPLGIMAMKELQKQNSGAAASDNMVMLVVLNTASLQLIPTTTALLRANAGAATPMDFMPATWMASAVSILSGICIAKLLSRLYSAPANSPHPSSRKPLRIPKRRERDKNPAI